MKKENFSRAVIPYLISDVYNCRTCRLATEGGHPIRPRGNISSYVTAIAEAPGMVEEEKDCTFIGPAGNLFQNLLDEAGLSIDKDFLCINAVQCRPRPPANSNKENGTPTQEDALACANNVKRIIEVQRPQLILLVGKVGLQSFIGPVKRVGDYVGTFIPPGRNLLNLKIPAFVINHPSYLLRNPSQEKDFGLNLLKLRDYMISNNLVISMR